jgi:TonB family protein
VAVKPITPENPIPRRVFATPIPYPLELAGTGFEAALSVRVVLNANGVVESANAGARAVAPTGAAPTGVTEQQAMEIFGRAAVEGVSRWQYDPPARAPIAFYVAVTFKPGAEATVAQSEQGLGVVAESNRARMATAAEQTEFAKRMAETQLSLELLARETEAARRGRPAGATPQAPGTRSGGAGAAPQAPGTRGRGAGAVQQNPPPRADGAPVRVGGAVMAPMQTRKVAPVYPEIARSARVQGVVILEVLIDEQGRVASARVLRSIPLLDQAALDAVYQWEYTPTLLNGVPVPVVMTATVAFAPEF